MEVDAEISEMYEIATKRGKALVELEKRNKRRRAKGLPPLLDEQAKADIAVSRRRYRTNDPTTVDAAEALKLFQIRKAQMEEGNSPSEPDEDEDMPVPPKASKPKSETPAREPAPEQPQNDPDTERAIREAEAVRRVEDMKNGRINHAGVWSGEGNKTEGGDDTTLVDVAQAKDDAKKAKDEADEKLKSAATQALVEKVLASAPRKGGKKASANISSEEFRAFMADLYERLKVSFESIETSISDLQGRVAEIVKSSARENLKDVQQDPDGSDAGIGKLLEQRTPVVFNVSGTKMTFDAVKVFYNSPCITILTKAGSANIMPEPGARLHLTYDMDGRHYDNDPVTFVGLRVDLPEFGMSFVGFVRDVETDLVNVDNAQKSLE